jgi:hypothetical protein
VGGLALALLGAVVTVSHSREREAALSPLASVDNTGPLGLAALHTWLDESGAEPIRLEGPMLRPPQAGAVILARPRGALQRSEVDFLLQFVEDGGLLIWGVGPGGEQPALESRLKIIRPQIEATGDIFALPGRPIHALTPHPLFEKLVLRVGGGQAISSRDPGAIPVAGGGGPPSAVSLSHGRGEILLLAGTELLENFRIAEGDNLTLWARLAERGTIAFDEYHQSSAKALRPAARGPLAMVIGQALLAALLYTWARGRRLGAIRPPLQSGPLRSAADYLAALGRLYRRARAERELGAAAWSGLRRRLQRQAGIPLTLDDAAVATRLAHLAPAAAEAYRQGAAAAHAGTSGPAALLMVTRRAAEVENALFSRGKRGK